MTYMKNVSGFVGDVAATVTLITTAPEAHAEALTLTDIAGRDVTLLEMPSKTVLGEGRMMYGIAPRVDDNPFEKVVGWKDDLVLYDPDVFRKFEAVADLVLLDVGNLFKAQETG